MALDVNHGSFDPFEVTALASSNLIVWENWTWVKWGEVTYRYVTSANRDILVVSECEKAWEPIENPSRKRSGRSWREFFRTPDSGHQTNKGLRFVVNEALQGRDSRLKGYTIAVEVYRRTEGFDPQVDPIVRVEAGRLRRALDHYYLTAGKNDPVLIEIPKRGYQPSFQMLQVPPSEIASAPGTSIAVMPLVDLTGDKEEEYFTDGLTEELTAELARYQDFRVIAAQSSMRFKGQKVDPREAGRDLNVRFLLTGSVRRDSNAVKIMVQLLDTSTPERIWGEGYRRDYTAADLIGIQ
jgi:TolB-like protein